jgi:hypothetical protein
MYHETGQFNLEINSHVLEILCKEIWSFSKRTEERKRIDRLLKSLSSVDQNILYPKSLKECLHH